MFIAGGRCMFLKKIRQAAFTISKIGAPRVLAGTGEAENLVWRVSFRQLQNFRSGRNWPL